MTTDIRAGQATTDVLLALRERIASGELAPGTALSVPAIATQLGVSRSPVREAVQALISDGLATHTPFAGAKVAHLDDDRIRDVLLVRRELEGLAAELAAREATDAVIAALRASLDAQRGRIEGPADEAADRRLDLEFHALVRAACGNEPLIDALARVEAVSHLSRSAMWSITDNRRLALVEHEAIFAALEHGDDAGARLAARAHVTGLAHRMARRA
jgi:DNA-binding GntR family transcriptional regulator